jgi:hypothetical protein
MYTYHENISGAFLITVCIWDEMMQIFLNKATRRHIKDQPMLQGDHRWLDI